MRFKPTLLFILVASLAARPVLGGVEEHNVARGFHPGRAYAFGDPDAVNLFNGNLMIVLPIGQSYPLGSGSSYGLTLTYQSKLWKHDLVEATPQQCGNPPGDPRGCMQERTLPSPHFNAGIGWRLSLGELLEPGDPDNSGPDGLGYGWAYHAPDGAVSSFRGPLHPGGDPGPANVSHTRDGTYLRLVLDQTVPPHHEIHFPDGMIHRFESWSYNDGGTAITKHRVKEILDPHFNGVTVTYEQDQWRLNDDYGREHIVDFIRQTGAYERVANVVSRVSLETFDGQTAQYDLTYVVAETFVGCPNQVDDDRDGMVWAPFLTGVTMPDGSRYSMPLSDGSYQVGAGGCNSTGLLRKLTLPTRGRIEWDYRAYRFPGVLYNPPGVPGPPCIGFLGQSGGVGERRVFDRTGDLLGTWTYSQQPDGPGGTCYDPVQPKQSVTTVEFTNHVAGSSPPGFRTKHYFSMAKSPGDPPWHPAEYGLPLTHNVTHGDKLLSTETFLPGASQPVRSTFVKYEYETSANPTAKDVLQRLAGTLTFVHDDQGCGGLTCWTSVDYSDFDGLGHYRRQRVSGNFPEGSTERVTYTNFNPGRGSTGSFVPPGANERWILDTFDEQWVEEAGERAFTRSCFDLDTGLLLGQRRYQQVTPGSGPPAATPDPDDLLTLFSYVGGNLVTERHYGGDVHDAPTGVFERSSSSGDCSVVEPSALPAFRQGHGYQNGIRANSRFVEPANPQEVVLQTLDRTIDASTGLAKARREPNGVATILEYDTMGRLTAERPPATAWTTYDYQATADPPRLVIKGRRAGVFTERRLEYDGLGRLIRDQRKVPKPGGGTGWSDTEFRYDGLGLKTEESVTVALTYSGKPLPIDMPEHWTTFEYDALGRVTKTTAPDGSVATTDYTGERIVEHTVSIDGSPSTTTETYDLHGRLIEVSEPSGVGAGGQAVDVATAYGYDFADRLTSVSMNGGAQQRTFVYDRLGFLRTESHPELGRRGGGARRHVLLSDYDAIGNVGRRTVEDGPTLDYVYDLAGRPTQVLDDSGRLLKEFFYAHTNDGSSNRRAGKLAMAKRHNYVAHPDTGLETDVVVTETFRYEGLDGQLSEIGIRSNRGPHFEHRYQYNPIGLEQLDLPICNRPPCTSEVGSGRQIRQTFAQGLVTAISNNGTVPSLGSLTYHPTGSVHEVNHGNGVIDSLDQDETGMARPALMQSEGGGSTLWSAGPFVYDGAGNVTTIGSDSYDYDRVGRLTRGFVQGKTQGVAYDPYGNITSLVTEGRDANLEVDPATNRLSMAGVAYDSSGNLTNHSGIADAVYDPFNRMTELTAQGVNQAYLYDADDNRVATLDYLAEETRWTVRDRGENVLADFTIDWDEDDVVLGREYVYRGDSLLASFDGADVRHYHLDHLGSTRLVTGSSGEMIAEYTYYPFGELVSATADDRLLFTGHERDFNRTDGEVPENDDLDYMLARHYAPRFGRFLSMDALLGERGTPQSWNRYAYALGNPMRYSDPDGRSEEEEPLEHLLKEYIAVSSVEIGMEMFVDDVSKVGRFLGDLTETPIARGAHWGLATLTIGEYAIQKSENLNQRLSEDIGAIVNEVNKAFYDRHSKELASVESYIFTLGRLNSSDRYDLQNPALSSAEMREIRDAIALRQRIIKEQKRRQKELRRLLRSLVYREDVD